MPLLTLTKENIAKAATHVSTGGIAAFPTETVYGLGANAFDAEAVAKIFAAKGRPADNPLIVHIADKDNIFSVIRELTPIGKRLLELLPAPLTLVCKRNSRIPDIVTAGLDTVAVRIPQSEGAREFIRACNTPIAAPSANSSTRPSPTKAEHVFADLGDKVEIILDGGDCAYGLESTVVDVTGDKIKMLRAGSFSAELLKNYGQVVIVTDNSGKPAAPGMKYKHYAPSCSFIAAKYGADIKTRITDKYNELNALGKKVIIFTADDNNTVNADKTADDSNNMDGGYKGINAVSLGANSYDYSHNLFSFMRLYENNYDVIIAECISDFGLGLALNNRILKASGGNII